MTTLSDIVRATGFDMSLNGQVCYIGEHFAIARVGETVDDSAFLMVFRDLEEEVDQLSRPYFDWRVVDGGGVTLIEGDELVELDGNGHAVDVLLSFVERIRQSDDPKSFVVGDVVQKLGRGDKAWFRAAVYDRLPGLALELRSLSEHLIDPDVGLRPQPAVRAATGVGEVILRTGFDLTLNGKLMFGDEYALAHLGGLGASSTFLLATRAPDDSGFDWAWLDNSGRLVGEGTRDTTDNEAHPVECLVALAEDLMEAARGSEDDFYAFGSWHQGSVDPLWWLQNWLDLPALAVELRDVVEHLPDRADGSDDRVRGRTRPRVIRPSRRPATARPRPRVRG